MTPPQNLPGELLILLQSHMYVFLRTGNKNIDIENSHTSVELKTVHD